MLTLFLTMLAAVLYLVATARVELPRVHFGWLATFVLVIAYLLDKAPLS